MKKKILAAILVLVGVVLFFSNDINQFVISRQSQGVVRDSESVSAKEIKENTNRTLPGKLEEEAFDFSKVEAVSVEGNIGNLFESLNLQDMDEEEAARIILEDEKQAASQEGSTKKEDGTKGTEGTKEVDGTKGTEGTKEVDETKGTDGTKASDEKENTEEAKKKKAAADRLKKYSKDFIVGIIKAPSIDLELGILRGLLNDNLYIGAGTMKKDMVMGEKNYAIAGHHLSRGALFHDVPDLKIGDIMYITDKETIYGYKVFSNKEVHETEVNVISDQVAVDRGKAVLTLVTCFTWDKPHIRTIVTGELVKTMPYTPETFNGL